MLASWLLVLGWLPMLLGVWRRGARRAAPASVRPARRRDARSGLDRMLLCLTWGVCAAQTAVALLFLRRDPQPARLAAGVSLFFAGMALWSWARATLGVLYAQIGPPAETFVTRGPYRLVRHPLYLGTASGCLGQAIAAGDWPALGVWVALLLVLAARATREERALRARFGPSWDAYAHHTARALPGLF